MNKILLTAFLCIISSISFAQTRYNITVVDDKSIPIPGVYIFSDVEKVGTITNEKGCAVLMCQSGSFEDIVNSKYIVKKDGYLTVDLPVESQKFEITVILKTDPNWITEKKESKKRKKQ